MFNFLSDSHKNINYKVDFYNTANNKMNINILWTRKSINVLNKIMKHINNIKLMQPLGYIIRHYINKYQPYDSEYKILTVDNRRQKINQDTLILAYTCEIHVKNYRIAKKKTPIQIDNKKILTDIEKKSKEIEKTLMDMEKNRKKITGKNIENTTENATK